MQIISKFKDYYDSSQQYGFDSDLLFIRNTEEYKPSTDLNKEIHKLDDLYSRYRGADINLLFFCGRAYPIVNIPTRSSEFHDASIFGAKPLYGTVQDYIDYVKEEMNSHKSTAEYKKWALNTFFNGDEKDSWYKKFNSTEKGMLAYATHLLNVKVDSSVFIEVDAPYFYVRIPRYGPYQITKNPKLSDYSFFKYMDSFTCYQEIRMYLGNILTKTDMMPITTGGDKVIAQQKGFDEMSFRTMPPGKKKEHRKVNRARKKNVQV